MKKFCLIILGFSAFAGHSQEINSQPKVLTLQDAINYAIENKADSKKARLEIENSEYQIQEVRSRALPQISLNGNLTYNPTLQKSFISADQFGGPAGSTQELIFGQKWSSVGGAALTQNIFDLAVFTGLKAARSTREFYKVNAQLTDEQVIERVANNYYQVYVLRQQLTVLDSNLVNTTKVRNIISGQFDNGLAKKIDLDRMNVNLSNISTQKQRALNALQLQENTLKFWMGMPIENAIVIPNTAFKVNFGILSEKPNTENRTEFKLLKVQEQLLTYQKKSIEAEYYPSLSLSAGFNYIGQGPEFPWGGKPEDKVYWSNYSNVGINLKVPIFTGFSTRARVRQADIKIRLNKEDLVDTKLSLDLAYENARTQIENSFITISNQKSNEQLAQEVLENTKNNYLQGLASLTDLLDAENSLVEAQNNYTAAMLEYKLAEIQLIKSKGELKTLMN